MAGVGVPINVPTTTRPSIAPSSSLSIPRTRIISTRAKAFKIDDSFLSSSSSPSSGLCCNQKTIDGELVTNVKDKVSSNKRVFFLDVNPICYAGSTRSLSSFSHWFSLFLTQVTHSDPVIAVLDGDRCNEYRRLLLPSYKAHRRKFTQQITSSQVFRRACVEGSSDIGDSSKIIADVLRKCNVPVIKVEGYEADDVIGTLVGHVLQRGRRVVIASPDKDFKQLVSEDVQMVMPLKALNRWSFYTLKDYIAQYNVDPHSDLSLRCIMGDDVDGIPGIQRLVPGFGRKTAVKLLKKHGSLENLLNAAAVRTVGKPYAQEALTKHADYLRRNYEVLSLRRDVNVHLQDEWLIERDAHNDSVILSDLVKCLEGTSKSSHSS